MGILPLFHTSKIKNLTYNLREQIPKEEIWGEASNFARHYRMKKQKELLKKLISYLFFFLNKLRLACPFGEA